MEKTNIKIDELTIQDDILKNMASVFLTVHVMDIEHDTFYMFNTSEEVYDFESKETSGQKAIMSVMSNVVLPEYRQQVLEFSDLTTLPMRMKGKHVISNEFIGKHVGWVKQQFIALKIDEDGCPLSVIHTTEVIDQHKKTEEELYSKQIKHSSIIHGLAGDFLAIYYVDILTGDFDIFRKTNSGYGLFEEEKKGKNYFVVGKQNGLKYVAEGEEAKFKRCADKDKILSELKTKNEYSFIVKMMYNGEAKYFKYKYVKPIGVDEDKKMIVGVYDVDAKVRKDIKQKERIREVSQNLHILQSQTEQLTIDALVDALTGLSNRRAYEDDMANEWTVLNKENNRDYVYFTIDINGLKTTNDNNGHAVGDELIQGVAQCVSECLAPYGKAYRVGGDEFVAIIYADSNSIKTIEADFNQAIDNWSGDIVKEATVSYGYVVNSEFPQMTIQELAKIADKRMYQNKASFYARTGVDRRGQQAAYDAICKSYKKILKVNLTTDSFSIIQMDYEEQKDTFGYNEKISKWLHDFATSGLVHVDDIQNYLRNTNMDYLRNFFKTDDSEICFYYRRKLGDEFKRCMMQVIRADEYSDENQIVFLYVKSMQR